MAIAKLVPDHLTDHEHLRSTRNARIRELVAQGWSDARIAAEVGLSDEGVRKIRISRPEPAELRAAERARLVDELDCLLRCIEAERRRITVIRRRLIGLDDRDESERIDRILGLL